MDRTNNIVFHGGYLVSHDIDCPDWPEELTWDNTDPKFVEDVYEATEIYIDGMMTLWDGAGEGVYKSSDNAREIRDKLLEIHDLLEAHKQGDN